MALAVFTVGASVAYTKSKSQPEELTAAPGQQNAVTALQQGHNSASSVRVAGSNPATAAQAPPVAPLKRVYLPDAFVALPRSASPAQLAAIQKISGVQGIVSVVSGSTTYDGRTVNALAVDPSTFRAYTPQPTAASDGLWQAVARGEAVASYELDKAKKLSLGSTMPLGGGQQVRLGALAEFSLPGVDLVLDSRRGAVAQLSKPALLVSAPSGTESSLRKAISSAVGGDVSVKMLRPTFTVPATYDVGGVRSNAPTDLRTLYMQAATTCPGLPWGVLAGIGQVETNHGQNTAVSSAGAMGPMQFLPSTWAIYGVDGDGDGKANILDQVDAVYSAARYLCAGGGGNPNTLYDAIFAYNHADWYVREVLSLAAQYR